MKKVPCPHCGESLNLGSLLVKQRWLKTSKKERSEYGKKMAEKRWKKLSTPSI